jgi:hypothetical protein
MHCKVYQYLYCAVQGICSTVVLLSERAELTKPYNCRHVSSSNIANGSSSRSRLVECGVGKTSHASRA